MNIWWKRLLIFLIITLFCVSPIIFIYEFSYKQSFEWNSNSLKIDCLITNHTISSTNCKCGCTTIVRRYCALCYSICYNGFISVVHNVSGQIYYNNFEVYTHINNENILRNKLNMDYQINGFVPCCYNKNNPIDSKLSLIDTNDIWNVIITFFMVGSFVVVIWLSYEIYYFKHKNKIDFYKSNLNVS